jgi:hypothetical protein
MDALKAKAYGITLPTSTLATEVLNVPPTPKPLALVVAQESTPLVIPTPPRQSISTITPPPTDDAVQISQQQEITKRTLALYSACSAVAGAAITAIVTLVVKLENCN